MRPDGDHPAYEELQYSEQKLAEAQAVAHIGSWEWDIPADKVAWSRELYRIFGLDPNEFEGTYERYLDRLHPDDREMVDGIIRASFASGDPFEFVHRAVRPDGEIRTIQAHGMVTMEGGQAVAMRGTAQDITERKRAEDALAQRTEELERSNQELEHFAYLASHDLQEPLRVIAGFVQLLQRRYAGRLDEDADRYIDFTVEGAERMQALIDSLLTYSRVGRSVPQRAPVDTGKLVERVLDNYRESIEERDGEARVGDLPEVEGDLVLLTQLFSNLIGNAVKFTDGGRPVIEVDAASENGEWVFSVTDNGPGIEQRDAERIFEMFQRLHGRSVPGTGIGLAICKRIAEQHGGRIWVESRPGEGSAFRFTIPAEPSVATTDAGTGEYAIDHD